MVTVLLLRVVQNKYKYVHLMLINRGCVQLLITFTLTSTLYPYFHLSCVTLF
jgi:hypothetical protein